MIKNEFMKVKAVAFDLDGTIYIGDSLVPGGRIDRLFENKRDSYFLFYK